MNETQKHVLQELIMAKKSEVKAVLAKEYEAIAQKALTQPSERLAQCIIQEESARIVEYIRVLRQNVKDDSYQAIMQLGLSESVASIIWADVMQTAGLPKASLCQREDIKVEASASKQNTTQQARRNPKTAGTKHRAELKRLEEKRNLNIGITTVGTVATVITCLVVPGWSGVTGVLKGAEVFVSGTGVVGAVNAQSRIGEINRIIAEEEKKFAQETGSVKPAKQSSVEGQNKQMIQEICKHQCQMNVQVLSKWLDVIETELIAKCEAELAQ